MIAIIDYNCGNLGSIKNMIERIGGTAQITSDKNIISAADKIILPGVGAFDYGIKSLHDLNLVEILNEKKKTNTPILGICLGAQLMCNRSEEGILNGLAWVDAEVKRFKNEVEGTKYHVPHIGWDNVSPLKPSKLFNDLMVGSRFYFVHSYHIICQNSKEVLTSNVYGSSFNSSFEKENIIGVQFHPEKSHKFGMKLLRNFIELY